MKSKGRIWHQAKQVAHRHKAKKIRHALSRKPENCKHNRTYEKPIAGGGEVRVCALKGIVCDSSCSGLVVAAECEEFEPSTTKESVELEFNAFLANADYPDVARDMPDLVALLWVLDKTPADVVIEKVAVEESDGTDPEPAEDTTPSAELSPYFAFDTADVWERIAAPALFVSSFIAIAWSWLVAKCR